MYVARYNYDETGEKVKYDSDNLENNSEAGLQNMMLDLLIASISSEWQYSESRQPLDAVTNYLSKTMLGDIDTLKGVSAVKHSQMYYASPSYHNDSKSNLMSGKMNLGAFALSNSHHMLTQAVDYAFKNNHEVAKKYGLRSLSKIHSDTSNYWDKHPKKGKPIEIFTLISDWLSAMVNAHVDVAKDAYINRLNVRKLTLNTVNLLLRGGKGESTFYFMAQDILVKYADAFEKYRGFYGVQLGGETAENIAYRETVNYYLKKYNELKSNDMPALNEMYNADALSNTEVEKLFNVEYLRGIMPVKNTAEWYLAQLKVLQAYQELQPAAKALSKAVTTSQIDTKKFGNNFALQQNFLLKLLRFYKEDKMFVDPAAVIKNSFLKEKLIKGVIEPRQYFSNMLIRTNPLFENIRNTIYTMLGSPEYLSSRSINNITRMMEASFKSKFFTDYAKNNGVNIRELLYGNPVTGVKSLPKRLTQLKDEIKSGKYPLLLGSDGTFSNTLLDNINEILQYSKDDLRLPSFISFKPNKDEDHNLDDHIIRAWEELFESEHKEIRDFARDLVIYSMITSGDGFGANNIFRYVPNSFRETCGYFDFIRSIEENPEKMLDYVDIHMIFRNLWWDDGIVPAIPYKRDAYTDDGVPTQISRATYKTSTVNKIYIKNKNGTRYESKMLPIQIGVPEAKKIHEIDELPIFTPYVKISFGSKNDPLTTFLYQFVGIRVNQVGKTIPVYQVVEKRGMNYKGKTLVDFANSSVPVMVNDVLDQETKARYEGTTYISSNIIPDNNTQNYLTELLSYFDNKTTANLKYPGVNGIGISTKSYKKGDPQKYPNTLFVFTENAQAYQATRGENDVNYNLPITPDLKLNVSDINGTNQAGIRTDEDGNLSENAYGIIVKKYQQDANGNFVKKEGQFQDTDADFEMFTQINSKILDDIQNSQHVTKVFPKQFAMGKAALPIKFAEWLQFELALRFNLQYEIKQNEKAGYEGWGLKASDNPLNNVVDTLEESTEEVESTTPETQYSNSFTFADGTVVPTPFELNNQQAEALLALESFYNSDATSFTLKGYAGTGKTTIMKIFHAWLKTKNVNPTYAAPTHRANAVTKMNNPKVNTITIHSLLGLKPNEDLMEAEVDLNKLEFNTTLQKQFENTTFIIDECSMINDSVYSCLVSACKTFGSNNKLIFLGDPAQLQPVKSNKLSKVFTDSQQSVELTKVERTGDNAILEEATRLRNKEELSYKTKLNAKGQGVQYTKSSVSAMEQMTKMVKDPRYANNPLFFKLLTATNAAVSTFNKAIRSILYGTNVDMFVKGEVLMAYSNELYNPEAKSKNPYGIVNSIDYKIVNEPVKKSKELPESGGIIANGYEITIQNTFDPSDIKQVFIIDPNDMDLANKIANRIDQIYAIISASRGDKRKMARALQMRTKFNDSFFTVREIKIGGKVKKTKTFDYGYAHTIHKSQGGTYDNVMVLGNDIEKGFETDPIVKQQLMYVAITRARDKVIYAENGNDKIVEENQQDSSEFTNTEEYSDTEMNTCKI